MFCLSSHFTHQDKAGRGGRYLHGPGYLHEHAHTVAIYQIVYSVCVCSRLFAMFLETLFRSSFSSQLTSYGLEVCKDPRLTDTPYKARSDPAKCHCPTWEATSDARSLVSFSDFLCGHVQHPRQKSLFLGDSYPFWSPQEAHPASGFTVLIPWLSGTSGRLCWGAAGGFHFSQACWPWLQPSSVDSALTPLSTGHYWKPDKIRSRDSLPKRDTFKRKSCRLFEGWGWGKDTGIDPRELKQQG